VSPEKAGGPAADRAPETATTVAPGSCRNIGTPEEADALGRLLELFPGSVVGEFEPNEQRSILEEADEVLAEPDGFELVPLDFAKLLVEGIPEPDVLHVYLVRGSRIWGFGPAESAKTLYFQWVTAKLTREGRTVVFISAENPLATDLDRMHRLRPDWSHLRYFHMPPLDLADPTHFVELLRVSHGADLVVIDTLSATWSGDENSNTDVVKLDREVLAPLVAKTGAGLVLIHHSGHPQAFVSRGGVGAGRGASAMGQKADIVLVFQSVGRHEFTVDHAKNRTAGGHKEPKARFRIIDTEDDGLDIERIGKAIDERVAQCMDEAVEVVTASDGSLGTKALQAALREREFGGGTVTSALRELRSEDPPRLRQVDGEVVGPDGRRRKGKPWRAA
jgi:hypothetical protein